MAISQKIDPRQRFLELFKLHLIEGQASSGISVSGCFQKSLQVREVSARSMHQEPFTVGLEELRGERSEMRRRTKV